MKLAFLSNWDSPHFQRWALELDRRGHDVHVITQHYESPRKGTVNLYRLPFKGLAGYFLNLPFARKIVFRIKPDLIHAHYATGYGLLGKFSSWKPFLISVYGDDVYNVPERSRFHRNLVCNNLRGADRICSTSQNMINRIMQLEPDLQNTCVIPFGIDTTKFSPKLTARTDDFITIGVVKLLLPNAGIDILLKAVRKVIDELERSNERSADQLRLLIVGSGPELSNLVALAKVLGLWHITEFAPQVPHEIIPAYFQRMDIYCALSREESFGVAALEASACEIPVIASREKGLLENHVDGVTALFVNKDEVSAAAKSLIRLILDPSLRSRLGRNGRKHVITNFEWNKCVNMMESVYNTVLNNKGMSVPVNRN